MYGYWAPWDAVGVRDDLRWLVDLTALPVDGGTGDLADPYDLLVDFGTLDDLGSVGRRAMAATVHRLSRPGSRFLLWCFYARREDLPHISFHGPSRMAPALEPGEETQLFGDAFDIETVHANRDGRPIACSC